MKCYQTRFLDAFDCHICGPIGYSREKHLVEIEGVLEAVCVVCCPAKHAAAKMFDRAKKRKYRASCLGSLPGHGAETPGGTLRVVPPSAEAPRQMNTTEEPPILAGHTAPQAELETQHEEVYTGITPGNIPCPGASAPRATTRPTRPHHPTQLALSLRG